MTKTRLARTISRNGYRYIEIRGDENLAKCLRVAKRVVGDRRVTLSGVDYYAVRFLIH